MLCDPVENSSSMNATFIGAADHGKGESMYRGERLGNCISLTD